MKCGWSIGYVFGSVYRDNYMIKKLNLYDEKKLLKSFHKTIKCTQKRYQELHNVQAYHPLLMLSNFF